MFKKTHITILLSLLLHVAIIMLLNNSQTKVIVNKSTQPISIKSYIYQPIPPKVEETLEIKPKPTKPKASITKHDLTKPSLDAEPLPPKGSSALPETKKESEKLISEQKSVAANTTPPNTQNFSYNALQQLRDKLKQQNIQQFQKELAQPNTGSIMHGAPSLVPHSAIAVPDEVKTKQATTTMSADKSIIKGDDGKCLLVEDLSVVGMEGITAVSGFACGETKFDKSFREHMRELQKTLGKR